MNYRFAEFDFFLLTYTCDTHAYIRYSRIHTQVHMLNMRFRKLVIATKANQPLQAEKLLCCISAYVRNFIENTKTKKNIKGVTKKLSECLRQFG